VRFPGWSGRKKATAFTGTGSSAATFTVCGDRLQRLFSVRSIR
jgi:hypothetical protein